MYQRTKFSCSFGHSYTVCVQLSLHFKKDYSYLTNGQVYVILQHGAVHVKIFVK